MKYLPLLFLLSGCVTAGYHQRKMAELKYEEITKAILLAEQVKDKRMSIRDMIKIMQMRLWQ